MQGTHLKWRKGVDACSSLGGSAGRRQLPILAWEEDLELGGWRNFSGGSVIKNLPSNAEDIGLILGQGTKILYSTK